MARDVERDRIIQELKRVSQGNDPMARAAQYIQNLNANAAGAAAAPTIQERNGLNAMHQAVQNAARGLHGSNNAAPDHAVRDMLTQNTLSMLNEDRQRHIATAESRADEEYIQWLTDVNDGKYRHIAHIIMLTARFAGELPHDLISVHARKMIKQRINTSQYVRYDDKIREVEQVIWELVHQKRYPGVINEPVHAIVTEIMPQIDAVMAHIYSNIQQFSKAALRVSLDKLQQAAQAAAMNPQARGITLGVIMLSLVIQQFPQLADSLGQGLQTALGNLSPIPPKLLELLSAGFPGKKAQTSFVLEQVLKFLSDKFGPQWSRSAADSWFVHSRMREFEKERLFTWLSDTWPEYCSFLQNFLRRHVDAWTVLVDPGLVGNARMACSDIASRNPRLRALQVTHVMNAARHMQDERSATFVDYFCGVIAARWRANSVFAAQPYKTRNEQQAVAQALTESSIRLHEYTIDGDSIAWQPRPQPRSLHELRHSEIFAPHLFHPSI